MKTSEFQILWQLVVPCSTLFKEREWEREKERERERSTASERLENKWDVLCVTSDINFVDGVFHFSEEDDYPFEQLKQNQHQV